MSKIKSILLACPILPIYFTFKHIHDFDDLVIYLPITTYRRQYGHTDIIRKAKSSEDDI